MLKEKADTPVEEVLQEKVNKLPILPKIHKKKEQRFTNTCLGALPTH